MLKQIIHTVLENRVLAHTLFWLSILLIDPLYSLLVGQQFAAGVLIKLFNLPPQILATYTLLYFLIPKCIYKRKYLSFFALFILSAFVFCTMHHLIVDHINTRFLTGYTDIHSVSYILTHPLENVWTQWSQVYLTVLIVSGIKIIKDRFEEKKQMALLEKEKSLAELNLMKAQINPRILTKSLRELQSLSEQQSEEAPEMVLKLSELLDYMLYQTNEDQVAIEKEIELLKNYLEIERIRYGNKLNLTFTHQLDVKKTYIAPLVLLSLVESAFQIEPPLAKGEEVKIDLITSEDRLVVSIFSTLMMEPDCVDFKKQISLIYPDSYKLVKKQNQIHLTLNLCQTASHVL